MSRKEQTEKRDYRLQTLITQRHRKKLSKLAKRYGRMNDVIEMGIDLVERFEETETCDTCDLHSTIDLLNSLGSMSNYVFISNAINEKFFENLLFGKSIEETFSEINDFFENDLELKESLLSRFTVENAPFSGVKFIKEMADVFKTFNIIYSSEENGKMILQVEYFKKYPEIVAYQLLSIFRMFSLTFDLKIKNNNIFLEWIDDDKAESILKSRDQRLAEDISTVEERLGYVGKISKFISEIQHGAMREGGEDLKNLFYLNEALEVHNWLPGIFVWKNKRMIVLQQEAFNSFLTGFKEYMKPEAYQKFLFEQGGILFQPKKKELDLDSFLTGVIHNFRDVYGFGGLQRHFHNEKVDLLLSNPAFPCDTVEYLLKGALGHQNLSLHHSDQCITKGDYQCVFNITRRNINVIVVDDEETVLRSLKRILELDDQINYGFFMATDAKTALETIQKEHIDLVMVDYHLEGTNGVELLKEIHAINSFAIRILFTGIKDINIATDAINKAKAHLVLTKPWNKDELLSSLRRTIKQSILTSEEALSNLATGLLISNV
ncbi:MAG: response regulator [Candidatus Odinarchaeota archaeon]